VGGGGNSEQKKKAFSSIFTTDTKSFIHVTCIAAMHIIFTRIGCSLFTCDMYMCRLRHINDSVLSSLKMEGIRLFLLSYKYQATCFGHSGQAFSVTGPNYVCLSNF
jgi:hypothetical protein